ncbi:hypothetical protein [Chryseobacterium sp. JV274]|uniref:hypothetical protein n=1 Tax=Chryseobacterium sp. JV274 TaxID=1932669 RepID=UPI000985E54F|nr:hypothetical protein [Chryseobacterium sp. JV274]
MKQLELTTNKRLLIVEYETVHEMEVEYSLYKGLPEADKEVLCKGSEITEDIISPYVENYLENMDSLAVYRKYDATEKDFEEDHWSHCADDAVDSFVSAVRASGYHWGDNPVKKPVKDNYGYHENINVLDTPPEWDEECYYEDLDKWQKAESRTFNPEKCIICEIL